MEKPRLKRQLRHLDPAGVTEDSPHRSWASLKAWWAKRHEDAALWPPSRLFGEQHIEGLMANSRIQRGAARGALAMAEREESEKLRKVRGKLVKMRMEGRLK